MLIRHKRSEAASMRSVATDPSVPSASRLAQMRGHDRTGVAPLVLGSPCENLRAPRSPAISASLPPGPRSAEHGPPGKEPSMSPSESLKSFLKDKKQRDEATGRASDKEEKIRQLSSAIDGLFVNIEGWLDSSRDEGIVNVERMLYMLPDDQLGILKLECMKIVVGASEVTFTPVGGSIAGASARVDMASGDRRLPIILLPDRGWHFLVRGTVTRTDLVTEESFGSALKEILEE
jgi:hypothetical protein